MICFKFLDTYYEHLLKSFCRYRLHLVRSLPYSTVSYTYFVFSNFVYLFSSDFLQKFKENFWICITITVMLINFISNLWSITNRENKCAYNSVFIPPLRTQVFSTGFAQRANIFPNNLLSYWLLLYVCDLQHFLFLLVWFTVAS